MSDAVKAARRLLEALENFVIQESILLRAGHYAQMAAVQRRASPVIARLCQLGREPGVTALRTRVGALLARRRENLSCLAERRAFLAREHGRLAAKRQRLRQLTAYRRPGTPGRVQRLNAAV